MRAGAPLRRQAGQLRSRVLRIAAVAALVAIASVVSFQLGSGRLRPPVIAEYTAPLPPPEPVCAQPLLHATVAIAGVRRNEPDQVQLLMSKEHSSSSSGGDDHAVTEYQHLLPCT